MRGKKAKMRKRRKRNKWTKAVTEMIYDENEVKERETKGWRGDMQEGTRN